MTLRLLSHSLVGEREDRLRQRPGWGLGPQFARVVGEGGRLQAVPALQHAGGGGGFGVAGQNRHAGLRQHRSFVDGLGDQVDGAAGLRVTGGQGARMGMQAGV